MEIEIYADVVFIINFGMNFLTLWIAKIILKKKAHLLRLVFGALVASTIYCILFFIRPLSKYLNSITGILLLLIGVVIAFKPVSVKDGFKSLAMTFVSSLALGGTVLAAFYFFDFSNILGRGLGFAIYNFPFKALIAASCFFYIIIKLFSDVITKKLINKQIFYKIKIHVGEQYAVINSLVDTGNTLNEPISGKPVIIAEFEGIKLLLPEKMRLLYYENRIKDLPALAESVSGNNMYDRLRMIPFQSIGEENGVLIGFRPDKIEIIDDDKILFKTKDVIIGIQNIVLSPTGEYNALFNPSIYDGTE